ncbi:hypothetical protein OPQ81_000546 [Rhizoctonia solani]|nr:hypothetical protein OPQ81_000546 [Rhizoctonia solani]
MAGGIFRIEPIWARIASHQCLAGSRIEGGGPKFPLFAASILLFLGYGGISFLFSNSIPQVNIPNSWPLTPLVSALTLCSFATGVAGSAGIISAMNAGVRVTEDKYHASATGGINSSFGLSAFFFSTLARELFPGRTGAFLSVLCFGAGGAVLLGAIFVRPPPVGAIRLVDCEVEEEPELEDPARAEQESQPLWTEHTPLRAGTVDESVLYGEQNPWAGQAATSNPSGAATPDTSTSRTKKVEDVHGLALFTSLDFLIIFRIVGCSQSPQLSPTSLDQFVKHLINPMGITEDFSHFTLNLLPSKVMLPDSLSKTSLDTVTYNLNDKLFLLQLSSTEYFIAHDCLELYEQLSSAHIDSNFHSLAPEDCLHLVSLHCIEYPTPPTSSAYTPAPMTTPGNSSSTGNTATISTIIIADKNYSINKLQGQEDYQIWHIQVEDMFQDMEVWDIVNKTSTQPSNNNPTGQATWDKKNRAALGALHHCVDTGPMTHIAHCMLVSKAWKILKNQYQSLSIATMTMLCNKFTSLHMSEGNDLKSHIKEL